MSSRMPVWQAYTRDMTSTIGLRGATLDRTVCLKVSPHRIARINNISTSIIPVAEYDFQNSGHQGNASIK